jgi:hypothetical protein
MQSLPSDRQAIFTYFNPSSLVKHIANSFSGEGASLTPTACCLTLGQVHGSQGLESYSLQTPDFQYSQVRKKPQELLVRWLSWVERENRAEDHPPLQGAIRVENQGLVF